MPDDTYPGRDIPEPLQQSSPEPPQGPAEDSGGRPLYLVILATVFVVVSLVLGIVGIAAMNSQHDHAEAKTSRSSSSRSTPTTTSAIKARTQPVTPARAATATADPARE